MSTYWKNMAKSVGYAAATGFYGLVTVILAKRALAHREIALNDLYKRPAGATNGKESTTTKG